MGKKKSVGVIEVTPDPVVAYDDNKLRIFGALLQDRWDRNNEAIDLEERMAALQEDDEDDVRERTDGLETKSGMGVVEPSDAMEQLLRTRKLIEDAQARIGDRTYGICHCGGVPHLIDEARMKAAPTTTSCGLAKGLVPTAQRESQAVAA